MTHDAAEKTLIGWAQEDITPLETTLIAGQFHARISEGIHDPITATAFVLDSGEEHAVMVSCDLAVISDDLRDAVRARLGRAGGPDPKKIILHATHTHSAPPVRATDTGGASGPDLGIDLPVMPIARYVDFAAERIANAVLRAWEKRAPGKVAYGMGFAVIGRNRRVTYLDGSSKMYGRTDVPEFSHIEGYEDHSVNLLATYDAAGALTGLVVNVPCPSQVSEQEYWISADYWHETREELRRRFGKSLFILPQCSAAGDQSPRALFEKAACNRMLELSGRTPRQEIAHRIANAVGETLAVIEPQSAAPASLRHHVERLELPANVIPEAEARASLIEAEKFRKEYETLKREIDADPARRLQPRWCKDVTRAYRRMCWHRGAYARFERQESQPRVTAEMHVIRLGDIAFASNPFEYYLDFGIRIKARSKAVQTFLVQLAANGTYVPSPRSVAGGGYGSMAASNPVGPEGGRQLAERTIEVIEQLWAM